MEESHNSHNLSLDKLKTNTEISSVVSDVSKECETVNCKSDSIDKKNSLSHNGLTECEKEVKSSKISSVLASYCGSLNESSDFEECELINKFNDATTKNKKKEFPSGSQVNETMACEICKEDITNLDVYNRGIHVNKCIDKQISTASTTEDTSHMPANENVFILECPLCFKHFSSPEMRSNHIKKCGRSKGLSLQSILKALELQERHVLERISLGLPAKPVKSVKIPKNPVVKKTIVQPKNKAQSDIQLAKALSLSLKNSSQHDDTENIERITSVVLKPATANQRPGKKDKKILSSTPLLVLRSNEDRKKLLLEKVESILTSAIDPKQDALAEAEAGVMSEKQIVDDQMEFALWHLSSKSSDKCLYYVEELLDWIKPSDVETGAKLFHLSQIPGHEIVTQLPCDYTFNTTEKSNILNDDCTSTVESFTKSCSFSVIESLSSLVASSFMSDVDIRIDCGTVIPAHKLILSIRCPPLKQDTDFCSGSGRASLKWKTVSFDAALQFLNFIYTGNIDVKSNMMSDLFYLANKYEVFDLQTVLNNNNDDDDDYDTKSEKVVNQEIFNAEKEPYSSLSCHSETTKNSENIGSESQEDMNMDFEIVYNCINSSLKPSQPTNTQPSILDNTIPFKGTSVSKGNKDSDIVCKADVDQYNSASNSSEDVLICDNLSLNSSASPEVFDVSDSENDIEDLSDSETSETSEVATVKEDCDTLYKNYEDEYVSALDCSNESLVSDNLSLNNDGSTSPMLFDVNDSENDADDLSEAENIKFEKNYSQTSALGLSNVGMELLNLDILASNSSDDSVKFLHSGYPSHNNIPEKVQESTSVPSTSPGLTSFSHTIKNLSPNSPTSYEIDAENIMSDETSIPFKNSICAELKSPYSEAQVSREKRYDLSPVECDKSTANTCIELQSPTMSYSQRLTDLRSDCKDKNLGTTEVKEGITDDSQKFISSIENETITDFNSVSTEYDNADTLKLSIESSSCGSNPFNTIKTDKNTLQISPVKSFASPKVCDSDNDLKSQETVPCETPPPIHDYMNFPPKNTKSDSSNTADSPLSFDKNQHDTLSDTVNDAVFESFHHFDHDISLPFEDQPLTLNSSKNVEEKEISLNENNFQTPKCSKITEKNRAVQVTDNLQSSNVSLSLENAETSKTASVSNKSEIQHQFQFSDSPITPLPDYKKMVTPEIKQALKRIGVKALPRKKAVALLSHVYDETHPIIDEKTNTPSSSEASGMQPAIKDKVIKSKKRKQTTQNSEKPVKKHQTESNVKEAILASPESDESGSENPEWLGCVPEMSFSQSNHDSPTKPSKDDIDSIKLYIQSNEELYYNVLNYIPLNLMEFHQDLKKNDIKVSIQKLMDFLDEQCITFTCPRKEEYKKKQTARTQRFRKNMIAKLSQQAC